MHKDRTTPARMTSEPPRRIRRLKYIEAFAAVMRSGSISGAARELGLSQPSVSQLIRNLESSVGAPLFVRRNGGIYPTSRAEAMLDDAGDLLALLDRFEMHWEPRVDRMLQVLRVSATMSIISEVLPTLLAELSREHPGIAYTVNTHPVDEMTNAVASGEVDFAFHTKPLQHPNIVNELQCEVPQVCILRRDHPLAGRPVLELQDLEGQDTIMPSRRDPHYQHYRDLFLRHRLNCRTVMQSPFAHLSIQMAAALNALSFNNVLIASIMCSSRPDLVWRPVNGLGARTRFYLSLPLLLKDSPTHHAVAAAFALVVGRFTTGCAQGAPLDPSSS